MAMSSTIAADFSEFVAECAKADQGLAEIQAEATKTETALAGMGDAAATSATATGEAVAGAGTKATQAGRDFKNLGGGLEVTDQALDALGVNVGKEINDLQKLGNVSLDTSTAIGKLGTAISVASAAMIGWQIGRKIAELTGSDKIIGDATASILGWRDAGQAAANNADVLQRAFQKTGQVFTDVHAASEALRKASAANAEQFNTGAQRVKTWEGELSRAKGGVGALKAEMEAGNSTTAQMASHFNVSTEAIGYLERQMRSSAAAAKDLQAEQDKAAQKAQQQAEAITRLRESMFGTDTIAKAQQYLAALGPIENLTRLSTEAQKSMNAELGKAIDAYTRMGTVAPAALREVYAATLPLPPIVSGLGAEWASVGEKVSVSTDKIVGDLQRQADAHKKQIADFEAETQRQVDAWNKSQAATDSAKQTMDQTTGSAQRLTVQIQQLTVQMTAYEKAIAGANLLKAYAEAGVATSGAIGLGGYEFKQLQKTGVPGGWAGVGWAQTNPPWEASTPWGTGRGATQTSNTLNVTVNNADAGQMADALVTEMRHRGIRL